MTDVEIEMNLAFERGRASRDAEIESLRQQLADSQKREAMLHGALKDAHEFIGDDVESYETSKRRIEALAATADLSGVILCNAEPFAWVGMSGHGGLVTFEPPKIQPALFEPCHRAWETK